MLKHPYTVLTTIMNATPIKALAVLRALAPEKYLDAIFLEDACKWKTFSVRTDEVYHCVCQDTLRNTEFDVLFRVDNHHNARSFPAGSSLSLASRCECGAHNCSHPEAALFAMVGMYRPEVAKAWGKIILPDNVKLSRTGLEWIHHVKRHLTPPPAKAPQHSAYATRAPAEQVVCYLLEVHSNYVDAIVRCETNKLKRGGYSVRCKELPWQIESDRSAAITVEDIRISRMVFLEQGDLPSSARLNLSRLSVDDLMPALIKTGRLFLGSHTGIPLTLGESADGRVGWRAHDDERWRMVIDVEGLQDAVAVTACNPWYVAQSSSCVGPLQVDLQLMDLALNAPAVGYSDLPGLQSALESLGIDERLPALPLVDIEDQGIVQPRPELHIREDGNTYPYKIVGEVYFHYGNRRIGTTDNISVIWEKDGEKRIRSDRDRKFEDGCLSVLNKELEIGRWTGLRFIIAEDDGEETRILEFQAGDMAKLRQRGWLVTFAPDFRFRLAETSPWSMDLREAEAGWYDVHLSAMAGEKPLDLVAIIRKLLSDPEVAAEIRQGGTLSFFADTGNGDWIEIPAERAARIMQLVLDLGAGEQRPKISRFEFHAVEGLDQEVALRGAEDIKTLWAAIQAPPEPLPPALTAGLPLPLRDYQVVGVQWLRTMLQAKVGVILADEMALGKTLQGLAHLWGQVVDRPDAPPSLVIVSKTLIPKWQDDRIIFTPGMSLISITAMPHIEKLQELKPGDVVLATYGIVLTHQENFGARPWNIVICDEAHQYLANPQALTTRAVAALESRQKVMMTGSPLQNKPSDLWALTNLTVPGLLRSLRCRVIIKLYST